MTEQDRPADKPGPSDKPAVLAKTGQSDLMAVLPLRWKR